MNKLNERFNLSIKPEIFELAKEVLTESEIEQANILSEKLISKDKKDIAIQELQNIIGMRPKRPIYYLNHEITYLPEETRDVVRYAGDYIDQLMKDCAHEKGKLSFLAFYTSLGGNIKRSKKVLGQKLYNALTGYNRFIYVPAKHEFDVDKDRPHLFSAKEAVFVCFMMKKLAEQIIAISQQARRYSEG